MEKKYLNDAVYNQILLSLKTDNSLKHFSLKNKNLTKYKILQFDNGTFLQDGQKKNYYGFKKLTEKKGNNTIKTDNIDLFFLMCFIKMDRILTIIKTKQTLILDINNTKLELDFSSNVNTWLINGIKIEYSNNTFAMGYSNSQYRYSIFSSFYDNEMFCKIAKTKKRAISNLNDVIEIKRTSY
jgi:hypothetical protein